MKLYRIAENRWNLKDPPWRGAIAIEEVPQGHEVPPVICWLTRDQLPMAIRIVRLLNEDASTRRIDKVRGRT